MAGNFFKQQGALKRQIPMITTVTIPIDITITTMYMTSKEPLEADEARQPEARSKVNPLAQTAQVLAVSQRRQLRDQRQCTQLRLFIKLQVLFVEQQPLAVLGSRLTPMLQTAQMFAVSQRKQLRTAGQETQLTKLELKVYPIEQQPAELPGNLLKGVLQTAQVFAASQRKQLRTQGQATQPTPRIALKVFSVEQQPVALLGSLLKPVLQTAQISGISQRKQLKELGQATQPTLLTALHVQPVRQQPAAVLGNRLKPTQQTLQILSISQWKQLRDEGQAAQLTVQLVGHVPEPVLAFTINKMPSQWQRVHCVSRRPLHSLQKVGQGTQAVSLCPSVVAGEVSPVGHSLHVFAGELQTYILLHERQFYAEPVHLEHLTQQAIQIELVWPVVIGMQVPAQQAKHGGVMAEAGKYLKFQAQLLQIGGEKKPMPYLQPILQEEQVAT